ncbi:hypothetical protein NQ314_011603 [Rhamnusium bicolor]|uniref:Putative ionotropic receptor ligand binding domain-containing protein n=1 Tax=Rhamnusium bicolor TaxID=1586634 RepID=A0AAV8XH03_9CUCU|nr:hypothetical protein NQ314_011603 [Rhamnusium bicolor]
MYVETKWEKIFVSDTQPNISLSKCVTEASKLFFMEYVDTVTFSLPLMNPNDSRSPNTLIQLTLRAIGEENRWYVLVKNLNMPNYVLKNTTRRYNYILQISNEREFVAHIKKLEKLVNYNPKVKFLVFSPTIFKTPQDIATSIIKHLWQKNVVNVKVLLANEENSTKFTIYSWYPYKENSCGSKCQNILPINHCWFGIFQNNGTLFEEELPKQINSCTIRAKYVDWPPFVMNGKYGFQLLNYFKSQGVEVNLLNMIAAALNLNVSYGVSKYWEYAYENGTIFGDLNLLLNNSLDILMGAYSVSLHRFTYFDSS